MSDVRFTLLARQDLIEIYDYIADDSLERAWAMVTRLERRCHMISEQPKIGRKRDELAADLRSVAEGNYVIFYRLAGGGGVEVVRVLHGARDLPAIFGE